MSRPYMVYWQGERVGEMGDPKADNFFTYGAWKPNENSLGLREMMDRISRGDEVVVELQPSGGGVTRHGYIFEMPDKVIEVRCDPSMNRPRSPHTPGGRSHSDE